MTENQEHIDERIKNTGVKDTDEPLILSDYEVFSLFNLQTAGLGNVFSRPGKEDENSMLVKYLEFHPEQEMRKYLKNTAPNGAEPSMTTNFFSEQLWTEHLYLREIFKPVIDKHHGELHLDARILLFRDICDCHEFIDAAKDAFEPFKILPITQKIDAYIEQNKSRLPETRNIYSIIKNSGVLEDILEQFPEG